MADIGALRGYLVSVSRLERPIDQELHDKIVSKIVSFLASTSIQNAQKTAKLIYDHTNEDKALYGQLVKKLKKAVKADEFKGSELRRVTTFLQCSKGNLETLTKEMWDAKAREIENESPGAVKLISLCAHFSDCKIPAHWLSSFCGIELDGMSETLFKLAKFRILRMDLSLPTCHLRKEQSDIIRREEDFNEAVQALITALEKLDLANQESWDEARLWRKHAKAILKSSFIGQVDSELIDRIQVKQTEISSLPKKSRRKDGSSPDGDNPGGWCAIS